MPPLTGSKMPWRVVACEVTGEHRLHVRFRDGTEGDVQFRPSAFYGVFAHLIDQTKFAEAYVDLGAVTWPGELDLAPDAMHAEIKAHGTWVLQ
jgi:hypothetical protein